MTRRLALCISAAALGLVSLATPKTADADRIRFSGGGHVRVHGGASVHWSRPAYRPYVGRSWGVSGRVYVGPRYNYGYYPRYYYPYPRYYYYYQPVPSYYGVYSYQQPQTYYPVQPATPATTAAIVVAPKPELPKLGIGLFAGGASVEGTDGASTKDSSDIGLLGRFRLTPGLLVEAEIGKTSYEDNLRVDRRIGGSLVYEIGAYNKFAPYLLAGMGVQQAEVGDGQFQTRQNFGELGIGIRYAVTPHFHLLFDVRAGTRATAESDTAPNADVATRSVTPPTAASGDNENYTRGRFAAVYNF